MIAGIVSGCVKEIVHGVVLLPIDATGSNFNILAEDGSNLVDESGNAIIQEEAP